MKIAVIIGTRPEAIKMAPVYLALRNDHRFEVVLIATAQHRQMLNQVLEIFSIVPDVDMDMMQPNQTLAGLTAAVVTGVQDVLVQLKPDVVLVHGDTTTCLAAALAAFYEQIPVGHVEAGLRTYDLQAPWPEEMNRRLVDQICCWCFAPTKSAAENLRNERVPEGNIFVTGNTVIDALLIVRDMAQQRTPDVPGLSIESLEGKKLILVTGHRRENFGKPFEEFCHALRDIAIANEDVVIVYPVHLNPNVQKPVRTILGNEKRVHLIEPVEYLSFVYLMNRSYLIITDSGGIQEEAPSLGKPVLVTREVTERPEAIEMGLAKLVGTEKENIAANVSILLSDQQAYAEMSRVSNPYGDGKASQRILDILCQRKGKREGSN